MSSSPAKIEANRANGAASNGPKTPDGKARSSANSLTHGLCSKRMVIPGENAEEFADFRARLWADLRPVGVVEQMLVERIIGCAWRLRRVVRIENEVLERAGNSWRMANQQRATYELIRGGMSTMLALSFEAARPATLDALARHEVRLERSLARSLHELERRRAGVPAIAVDVEVGVVTGRDDADEARPDLDADAFEPKSVSDEQEAWRSAVINRGPTLADLCGDPEFRVTPDVDS